MTPTTPSPISDQAAGERAEWIERAKFFADVVLQYPDFDCDCKDEPRPICKMAHDLLFTAPTTGSAPEQFPYQKTFDAIAAATEMVGTSHIHISVLKFREAFGAAPASAAVSVLTDAFVDEVMEQAQVFASAWSMVGGPFDFGEALETAESEKVNLRALLAASMGGDKS